MFTAWFRLPYAIGYWIAYRYPIGTLPIFLNCVLGYRTMGVLCPRLRLLIPYRLGYPIGFCQYQYQSQYQVLIQDQKYLQRASLRDPL